MEVMEVLAVAITSGQAGEVELKAFVPVRMAVSFGPRLRWLSRPMKPRSHHTHSADSVFVCVPQACLSETL